jgi:hypothetical protein
VHEKDIPRVRKRDLYTQALKGRREITRHRTPKKTTIRKHHPLNLDRTTKNEKHKSNNIQNRKKNGSQIVQLQIVYGSGSLRQMPRLYISVTGNPANEGNCRELQHEKEHSM